MNANGLVQHKKNTQCWRCVGAHVWHTCKNDGARAVCVWRRFAVCLCASVSLQQDDAPVLRTYQLARSRSASAARCSKRKKMDAFHAFIPLWMFRFSGHISLGPLWICTPPSNLQHVFHVLVGVSLFSLIQDSQAACWTFSRLDVIKTNENENQQKCRTIRPTGGVPGQVCDPPTFRLITSLSTH